MLWRFLNTSSFHLLNVVLSGECCDSVRESYSLRTCKLENAEIGFDLTVLYVSLFIFLPGSTLVFAETSISGQLKNSYAIDVNWVLMNDYTFRKVVSHFVRTDCLLTKTFTASLHILFLFVYVASSVMFWCSRCNLNTSRTRKTFQT